jgi:glycosyltransferase involved in cell wall biosynthesis
MLCECVPVGSSVAALPFIIGDSGFILEKRDTGLLKSMLEEITAREDLHKLGKKARQRIIDNFYPGSRSEKLVGIIERLTG